jgi:hypothetical protein
MWGTLSLSDEKTGLSFTTADPLPSNGRHVVARTGSRGNVFTESLRSNGSVRHNIIKRLILSETNSSISLL